MSIHVHVVYTLNNIKCLKNIIKNLKYIILIKNMIIIKLKYHVKIFYEA